MDKPTAHLQVEWDHSERRLTFYSKTKKVLIDGSIFLNYECSFLVCLSRLSLRLQANSQKWHWNGFSPVCISMWILVWAGDFMILEQNGHAHELFPSLIGSFWKKNDFQIKSGPIFIFVLILIHQVLLIFKKVRSKSYLIICMLISDMTLK